MSTKGIYSALSGALAQSQQLDTIANNIANASTPGFKADKNSFREHLTILEKAPDVITVPRIPASTESFYDMQGTDKSFVDVDGTYTDFAQGGVKATGNALDLALEGPGFIEVLTPTGPKLTRKGSLTVNGNGQLTTVEGWPVLKRGNGPVKPGPEADFLGRTITVGPGSLVFTNQGDIFQDGNNLGQLSIVEFKDPKAVKKVGHNLYTSNDPNLNREVNPRTEVHQGFIETSNVNIVKEMTDMIQTQRNFESAQKVIRTYDEMDNKLVNEVPKLG